jgi:hypothetical protein
VIIEAITSLNKPWDDLHHRSYFLRELRRIEAGEFTLTMNGDRSCPINPLATHEVYTEGNMETIAKMIPIDISKIPGVVENVFIGEDCSPKEIRIYMDLFKELCDVFSWFYEEMPGIDPRIMEHEIMTYPNAKPFRLKIYPVNPKKATVIKAKVEKMLNVSFIYLIQLTQWVSNLIPVNKK